MGNVEMKNIGFKCQMMRYIESEGIAGVKKIMKELGVVIEYKQGSKEFSLLSDGYSSVKIRVNDGDFVVKIPAGENNLERDAFFILNPAIALGCILEEKPKKSRKKKEEKEEEKLSPFTEMIKKTAKEMSSPEYQTAMSELRRAQAELNKPFLGTIV